MLAPHVEVRTTNRGVVTLDTGSAHVLRLNVGDPARGACRHHRFVYQRGDMDLFPAGVADTWHEDDANKSVLISLSQALMHRAARDSGHDPAHIELGERHQFRDRQVEHIALALDAARADGAMTGLYAESLGFALAIRLLGYGVPKARRGGLSRAQIRRLTEHIEANLDRTLSLASLADIAGVSVSHLKTLFRQSMGMPVHRYVVQRRVERARSLLVASDLPASQVALDAGFSHQSHMARCMRRVLGATPASFRT